MRKTPEFRDHVAMFVREFLVAAEPGEQGDRAVLQLQILGMHERHVEENAPLLWQLLVEIQIHRLFGNLLRQMIGGKGIGAVPEHVARELVEEDDSGERGFRRTEEGIGGFRFLVLPEVEKAVYDPLVQ